MKIALGSDHRGAEAVRALLPQLQAKGHEVVILGDCKGMACDYPDHAWTVGSAVGRGEYDRGILICGTGIGMSIAANKIHGVRAALVQDEVTAEISRRHNDANVLCLSGDMTPLQNLPGIVNAWLNTPFEGGRHERRVQKIAAIENGENPSQAVMTPANGAR